MFVRPSLLDSWARPWRMDTGWRTANCWIRPSLQGAP